MHSLKVTSPKILLLQRKDRNFTEKLGRYHLDPVTKLVIGNGTNQNHVLLVRKRAQ